jgi:hypothetical protein
VKEAKKQLEEHKSNRDPIDATISGLRAECDKLKGDSSTQVELFI